jgi:hypothetical protein
VEPQKEAFCGVVAMDTETPARTQERKLQRWIKAIIALLAMYIVLAYLFIPFGWKQYAKHHPSFDDNPRITETADGHPGDPLNVGLIGTQPQVIAIMTSAKWSAADPLSLRSDIKIGTDTVLGRSYDKAPVSNLYLFGRKEDLAFEHPVGDDPRKRNHVRFWQTGKVDRDGRPVWIGSASYDKSVGFSHTTGQITHHIAPDVDTERNRMFTELEKTGDLSEMYKVTGFHKDLQGKNGGGDPWHTDGDLLVGVISVNSKAEHP